MYLERRIAKAEQKLSLNQGARPFVLVCFTPTDELASSSLPENTEDWITYKGHIRKYPGSDFVLLFASVELTARGLSNKALNQDT
jgi:hypothetical protein